MPQTNAIEVNVLLFAHLKDIRGGEFRIIVPAGADVKSFVDALLRFEPAFSSSVGSLRFAVNGDWADCEQRLCDGDEIALIPPVSGG